MRLEYIREKNGYYKGSGYVSTIKGNTRTVRKYRAEKTGNLLYYENWEGREKGCKTDSSDQERASHAFGVYSS